MAAKPKPPRSSHRPGNYVPCGTCGRLLRIDWPVRSIVCACGARIDPRGVGK
jgi:hypothetical protein